MNKEQNKRGDVILYSVFLLYRIIVLSLLRSLLKMLLIPKLLRYSKKTLRYIGALCFGAHPDTGIPYTLVNLMDKDFSIPKDFYKRNPFPSDDPFSLTNAHLLCMCSKLAYEDDGIVESEVKKWGMTQYCGDITYDKKVSTHAYIFGNERALIIAFRGTEPLSFLDWYTDLEADTIDAEDIAGKIHKGFLRALGLLRNKSVPKSSDEEEPPRNVYETAMEIVEKYTKEHPNTKLFITGHSLGAALAIVFAAKMVKDGRQDLIGSVYTFGCPRVGDSDFANSIDKLNKKDQNGKPIGEKCRIFRIVNSRDLIPHVPPPKLLGYQYKHHGVPLLLVTDTRKIIHNPSLRRLQIDPFSSLYSSLWKIKDGYNNNESSLRLTIRIIGCFVPGIGNNINDHMPCDYERGLRKIIEDGERLVDLVDLKQDQSNIDDENDYESSLNISLYSYFSQLLGRCS